MDVDQQGGDEPSYTDPGPHRSLCRTCRCGGVPRHRSNNRECRSSLGTFRREETAFAEDLVDSDLAETEGKTDVICASTRRVRLTDGLVPLGSGFVLLLPSGRYRQTRCDETL